MANTSETGGAREAFDGMPDEVDFSESLPNPYVGAGAGWPQSALASFLMMIPKRRAPLIEARRRRGCRAVRGWDASLQPICYHGGCCTSSWKRFLSRTYAVFNRFSPAYKKAARAMT